VTAPANATGNRTGLSAAPGRSEDMLAGTAEFAPSESGDEREFARARTRSTKESDPLGSTPAPVRIDGLLMRVAPELSDGGASAQLLDKLGERLGFERMSVRLYEALIAKFDAATERLSEPSRLQLEHNLRDEFDHFRMLEEAMAMLGGDPTALTPAADLQATMTKGVLEMLVDPRTSFAQCLEGLVTAELIDNEAWDVLLVFTEQAGQPALASRFARARACERQHLRDVRRWLALAQGRPPPA
jgi:hypothetical protein